jgi:hypothetical protein
MNKDVPELIDGAESCAVWDMMAMAVARVAAG